MKSDSSTLTPDSIKERLKLVKYPGFSRDIVSFGLVKTATWVDGTASVMLALTTNDPDVPAQLRKDVEECLRSMIGVKRVVVEITTQPAPTTGGPADAATSTAPKMIQHAVAIASGKGGVGKSTFAVNLACALAQVLTEAGHPGSVGLLDCDIHGPSVPLMIGLSGHPEIEGEGADAQLIPMEKHGVKVMSMGLLIEENTPVIWRGPMIMKTVQQFVKNVRWGTLKILLIDLPPGTGDAQLSIAQTLKLDGAIIVTTPQIAATQIARKGGLMFQKVNVPILGIAENMSYFLDPAGNKHALFGEGGGETLAKQLETILLGKIPLLPEIRTGSDSGMPITVVNPSGTASNEFQNIARTLLMQLAQK